MTELGSYARLATPLPDGDVPLLRELLGYDAQCEASCELVRWTGRQLLQRRAPSPLHWSRQVEWPWAVKAAALEPHHRVLDVGGGWAVLQYALAKRCAEVVCLDPDPLSHVKAGGTATTLGVRNVRRREGDGRDVPYPDGSFDRVVCVSVLEHVESGREKFLDECARVLKPGGVLVLSLDFVFEGEPGEETWVTPAEASKILERFDLWATPPEGETALAATLPCGRKISVLLIRWAKPEAA